jgi:hypothetical protein
MPLRIPRLLVALSSAKCILLTARAATATPVFVTFTTGGLGSHPRLGKVFSCSSQGE